MWLLIYLMILFVIIYYIGRNILQFERERKQQILDSKLYEICFESSFKDAVGWFFLGIVLFFILLIFRENVTDEATNDALFFTLFLTLLSFIFLYLFGKIYINIREKQANQKIQGKKSDFVQWLSIPILGIISIGLVFSIPIVYRNEEFQSMKYQYYETYAQAIVDKEIIPGIKKYLPSSYISDLQIEDSQYEYNPKYTIPSAYITYDVHLIYRSDEIDTYYQEIINSPKQAKNVMETMVYAKKCIDTFFSSYDHRVQTRFESFNVRYYRHEEDDFGIVIHGKEHTYQIIHSDMEYNILYVDGKKVYTVDNRPSYIPPSYEKPKEDTDVPSSNSSTHSSGSTIYSYDEGYNAVYEDGDYDMDRYDSDSDYANGVDDAIADAEEDFGEVW